MFFTDVRVPDSQRLGGVGEGWKVSLTTLMNERLSAGRTLDADMVEFIAMIKTFTMEDGSPAIKNADVRGK
ncbi:MAG TPA: acyl-CoA dehydrogenase, partial [Porticoccaceae bacterium]|nr:acyl-CoA dehydrogenase [Porticoccaceae bacterium]